MNVKATSPWKWVPSLYFMEGLPFTMVVVVSTIMYKNFGIDNALITYYTGWLVLPWTLKPLWSWFIDLYRTKRWWIYSMQFLFSLSMVLAAVSLHLPAFFQLSLIAFSLSALAASSHDIAADGFYLISLTSGQQSFFVGMQSAFFQVAKIFGSGLLVIISGYLLKTTNHNAALSWSIVLFIAAGTSLIIAAYHFTVLPRTEVRVRKPMAEVFPEIKDVFVSLFKLEQIWIIFLFALTFRLGETMLAKTVPLFILDSRAVGGLGFDNSYMGLTNICTLISTVVAGILGGVLISKFGLKRCLWPMLLFVNIPHLVFVYLAYAQPTQEIVPLVLQIVEYFAVNISLTGYMMVLFYAVRDSKYKTSHYAFIAAIMMLANMVPSMISGSLQEMLGYKHYFVAILFTLVPSLFVIPFIKIDSGFGLKQANE
jgi:PAT family beta-lactamase induction signal transducer AmpG